MKKIVPPRDVPPVTVGPLRCEVPHWGRALGWGQNGGHVLALDALTGAPLWRHALYEIDYRADMEADKQDSFITSLEWDASEAVLVACNDRGRRFAIDLVSRQVTER